MPSIDPTERFSFASHSLGAVAAAVGLVALLARAHGLLAILSCTVYGATMVVMLCSSSLHHAIHPASPRGRIALRRMDHVAIFAFIAGTYTPVSLVGLGGAWGWVIFGLVWALAAAGTLQKVFWLHAPRWLGAVLYLGVGWVFVVGGVPMLRAIPVPGLVLLGAGGLVYSVGAIVYAAKRPDPFPRWLGFHGLWHVMVLVAAGFQFAYVYVYATGLAR